MRKIDYQILADSIRAQLSVNNWATASVNPECEIVETLGGAS